MNPTDDQRMALAGCIFAAYGERQDAAKWRERMLGVAWAFGVDRELAALERALRQRQGKADEQGRPGDTARFLETVLLR
jgi:hypothetical protein